MNTIEAMFKNPTGEHISSGYMIAQTVPKRFEYRIYKNYDKYYALIECKELNWKYDTLCVDSIEEVEEYILSSIWGLGFPNILYHFDLLKSLKEKK